MLTDSPGTLLAEGRRRLSEAPFEPSTREAALLLGRVLELSEAQVMARSAEPVPAELAVRYRALLERRLTGEPIAYILGEREFYGRPFRVDSRVLIPRPETEHLIEAALELSLPERPAILEIGAGSGCLAVTLALEIARSTVVATDMVPGALAVAAANVHAHSVEHRVRLVAADLAGALELTAFDLVISNPPYIDPSESAQLSIEVTDFEPAQALFAPDQGTAILERLTSELSGLRPGTPILLEIGYDQEDRITQLADKANLTLQEVRKDLAGHPRVALLFSR